MILFSDAIFAIAITLLVLEIKVPDINRHVATDEMLLKALDELMPKFIGFFLSFFFVGLYWTIHHRMFGYVINYNRRLLTLNLIFLLAVVLMPFSTGFYSEYILRLLKVPMIIYSGNIIFLGIMNVVLWRYISDRKNQLSQGITNEEKKYFMVRAITVPVIFLFVTVFYVFVNRIVPLYILVFIPLIMRFVRKAFNKKPTTVIWKR